MGKFKAKDAAGVEGTKEGMTDSYNYTLIKIKILRKTVSIGA